MQIPSMTMKIIKSLPEITTSSKQMIKLWYKNTMTGTKDKILMWKEQKYNIIPLNSKDKREKIIIENKQINKYEMNKTNQIFIAN